jgi:hypothetical protein
MLGTKPADQEVFASYVASKAPNEDTRKQELESMEHVEESGTTMFMRHPENRNLCLQDYQILGFLKAGGEALRNCNQSAAAEDGRRGKKWGSIKSKIDRHVVVEPQFIDLGKAEPDDIMERPQRCETMKGPRVSLARSEVLNPPLEFDVQIDVMDGSPVSVAMVEEILDYGRRNGLGQWRNAGNGRFDWEYTGEPPTGSKKAKPKKK